MSSDVTEYYNAFHMCNTQETAVTIGSSVSATSFYYGLQ